MVFYRKYRPQKISELDLASVREKLTKVLQSPDLPHAFLFTGPKGLGKTSSARILAKAINCENRAIGNKKTTKKQAASSQKSEVTSIEPCNTCDFCTSITNGSHVDVLEIDAASNRGIDEIRELREKIRFAPASASKKIYIIDEVHMLTTEAFNALLKTLEEPPSHVVFILCTTEEWKIPETIMSRTFHVRFEKPGREEVMRSLKRIVEGEKLDIDQAALETVYELSDGAFRDAAKALEELSFAANGGKITLETIETVFKLTSVEHNVKNLLASFIQKDMKKALQIIQAIAESGVDFKIVNEKIVDVLHAQLLIKSKLAEGEELDFSIPEIKKLLQLFNTAYGQLRFAVLPQLPLEIAVLDYFFSQDQAANAVVRDVELPSVSKKDTYIEEKTVRTQVAQTSAVIDAKDKGVVVIQETQQLLYKLIDEIKQDNHTLAGILRSCRISDVQDGTVVLSAKYKFHGDRLSDAKAKTLIQDVLTDLRGKPTIVHIQINE